MNLHHAAALAMLGWYLMVPPPAPTPRFDLKAPLSKWSKKASFNSQKECNDALATRRLKEARDRVLQPMWAFGKCVASDDPRLKEK
jgi:hypothetical protein